MASQKSLMSAIILVAGLSMAVVSIVWWFSAYYYVLEPIAAV